MTASVQHPRAEPGGDPLPRAQAGGSTRSTALASAPRREGVAYLTSQYPAASHTFIRREIAALRRRGIEVDTFSIRPPARDERTDDVTQREHASTFYVLPPAAARVLRSHVRAAARRPRSYASTLRRALGHRVPGARALVWSVFHFGEAIHLAEELERRGVVHLHNHFANSAATVGWLASRFADIGWSVTLHGISEFDYPAGLLLGEKIADADFVACVSHFGRAQAQRVTDPEHWEKLFIVRCGVEPDSIGSAQPRTSGRLRVLHVGRLSPEKGQLGLLQAFATVVRAGIDAELVIIGDGPERGRLDVRTRELGLEDRVEFLGRRSESGVLEALVSADAFALSSFMEGLPVVLMEAMAAGVPVVAPRVAGIPELVEHDRSGLLFSPSDWDDFGRQLGRLLRDAPLREKIAEAGRRRVREEFDVDRAVEPLCSRFEAVLR